MTQVRCLVLGAGGFIGTHLCRALIAQGHRVRAVSRCPRLMEPQARDDQSTNAGIEWRVGDFKAPETLQGLLADIDVVYHLASSTTPSTSNRDPIEDAQVNIIGTLHLLEAARAAGKPKIVFVSSGGAIYGIPRKIPITERCPTNPISAYGINKLAIEKYLNLYQVMYGLDYCVLRVSNPFGEKLPIAGSQGVVGIFIRKALCRETIEIWGTDQTVRDFVCVEDVVTALLQAKDYRGEERIFNIGSGQGRSLKDVIDAIEAQLGYPVARRVLRGTPPDVPVNILDISLAREELGWIPRGEFHTGLQRTIAWVRDQVPPMSDRVAG